MNSCRHLLQLRWPVVHGVLLIVGCGGETSNGIPSATGGNSFVGVGGQSGLGGYASLGGVAAVGGTGVNSSTTSDAGDACASSNDCTFCAYTSAPTRSSDCYCAQCATMPMNKDVCNANQAAYLKYCIAIAQSCPAIPCVMPSNVMCNGGTCVPWAITN